MRQGTNARNSPAWHPPASFTSAKTPTSNCSFRTFPEPIRPKHLRTTTLYRYRLDMAAFSPWSEASGQWTSPREVRPLGVEPVGDLLTAHAKAEIELRFVTSLHPLRELAESDQWDFSLVRMANARPRVA